MEGYLSTRCSSWFVPATVISLLLLGFGGPAAPATARALPASNASTEFITTSCSNTTYPRLCIASLVPYARTIQASPTQLTRTALSVSLDSARSASDAVATLSAAGGMKPREVGAVSDCTMTLGDAVVRLQRSLDAMGMLGGKDAGVHADDVLTWVSAALTDENSCMDGLAGSAAVANSKVRGQIWRAVQLTCNALSFMNTLASKITTKH